MSTSPTLVPVTRHHTTPFGQSVDWWGFVLFLVSEAWIFLNLIAAYVYLRWLSPAAQPMALPHRELLVPSVNTAILLGSGLVAHWASTRLDRGDERRLERGFGLTIVLGLLFLAGQAYEYAHAAFTPQSSAYGACFFTLTGLHGLHVVFGLAFLLVLLLRARRGAFTDGRTFPVEAGTLYWHFVDAVWVVLFGLLYLI
jgi:heme/copper-type cytochrome/quinol oxidase subunit 3